MAASSLGGVSSIKLSNFYSNFTKTKCCRLVTLDGTRRAWTSQKPIELAGLVQSRRCSARLSVTCATSSDNMNNLEDDSEGKKSNKPKTQIFPSSLEVESLITEICDTTTIAEFELKLKLGDFRLYVTRNLNGRSIPSVPPSPLPINSNTSVESHDSNGSVATTSLAISKPKPFQGGIQRLLETATDEGLVILQSPKKQTVKEGQVLCFIEQLGGEVPIKSDISGEVIKILRKDGEPVGYGDALIAILPSFPGIKKLH